MMLIVGKVGVKGVIAKVRVNSIVPRLIRTNDIYKIIWRDLICGDQEIIHQELTTSGILWHIYKRSNGGHNIDNFVVNSRNLFKSDLCKIVL